ncbi:hypothetical protein DP42_3883 [Burkholderia pseudomallei]|nr:hypothetical protein DP42_3883 [Burkholderia pseudomallei]
MSRSVDEVSTFITLNYSWSLTRLAPLALGHHQAKTFVHRRWFQSPI